MYISDIDGQSTVVPILNELSSSESKINNNFAHEIREGEEIKHLFRCNSSIFQSRSDDLRHREKIEQITLSHREVKKKFRFFGPWTEKGIIFKENWKYEAGYLREWSLWQKKGPELKCEFNYTIDWKLEELLFYGKGELYCRTWYNYSQEGRLEEEIRTNPKADIREKVCYEYDGEEIIARIMNEESQTVLHCCYVVRDNMLVEAELLKGDSFRPVKFIYTYDTEGKLREGICLIKGDRRSDRLIYKYDEKGNRVEDISLDEKDEERNLLRYDYDRYDNVIGETYIVKGDNSVSQFGKLGYSRLQDQNKLCCGYEYDERGNWTRRDVFSSYVRTSRLNYKPLMVEERDITYQ